MSNVSRSLIAAILAVLANSVSAIGAVNVTQGATGPTYATTLTFDEPGTPAGLVATDYWHDSKGVDFQVFEFPGQKPLISNVTATPGYGWLGTGNSAYGDYGFELDFVSPLTAFSGSVYDPSGPPTFFGGGFVVDIMSGATDLNANAYTAAWGGVGKPVFNVTTTAGSTFNKVILFGNGQDPTTYIDNLSWTVAVSPEPTSLLALATGGLSLLHRSRR